MLTRMGEGIKQLKMLVERRDIYMMLLIILVAGASFGLGRLSGKPVEKTPVRIENAFESAVIASESEVLEKNIEQVPASADGGFVGSKNSDKYHFPWCPGAIRIKEDNKVWFASREEAEQAGYVPAANCKGL